MRTVLCHITNISKSAVYGNLNTFGKGPSELQCSGSGLERIFDVNANRPYWSAHQIANEYARSVWPHVDEWTIS